MPMPTIQTTFFGFLNHKPNSVYEFPDGIPGFEDEKQFVFIDQPSTKPLVFMQSVAHSEVCFLGLPIRTIEPNYRLHVSTEDLLSLSLPPDRQPEIGAEVLCLALISVSEGQPPTANLLAPIIVNLAGRRGVQAIQVDTDYSHQHTFGTEEALCW